MEPNSSFCAGDIHKNQRAPRGSNMYPPNKALFTIASYLHRRNLSVEAQNHTFVRELRLELPAPEFMIWTTVDGLFLLIAFCLIHAEILRGTALQLHCSVRLWAQTRIVPVQGLYRAHFLTLKGSVRMEQWLQTMKVLDFKPYTNRRGCSCFYFQDRGS